jgi:probable HAF family extracellular repeat protein
MANGTAGSMMNLGDLPGGDAASGATDINAIGQIVGNSDVSTGTHAFLWSPVNENGTTGSMVDLGDFPGGIDEGIAMAINSAGQVVGQSQAATGPRAFLWSPSTPNGTAGSMVDLGDLTGGADRSIAWDINSAGQIVGQSATASGSRAMLWTPDTPNGFTGSMIDLNSVLDAITGMGWTLREAYGINDRGQIIGGGLFDADGPGDMPAVTRGYLLTPIPEPSAQTLGVVALVCISGYRFVCRSSQCEHPVVA